MPSPDTRAASRLSATVLIAFAAVYLIWGSTYLAIRIGVETLPPFLLAGSRYLLAGAILYAGLRWRGVPAPPRSTWKGALLIGGLMMFGGNGLVSWAQQTVPSAIAALIVATVPLWLVVLDATAFRGPRPGGWVALGLLFGIVGVGVLAGPADGGVDPVGAVVLLVASLSWATGSLLNRSANLPASPWMSAATQMLAGGGLLIVAATVTGEWTRLDPAAIAPRSLLALLYLAIFGSIVAHTAYIYLLRATTAAAVSTYAFVNPVIALVLGWLTGEVLGARALTGAVLIVGSVVLIHRARRKPAPKPAMPCLIASESPTASSSR